MKTKVKDVIEKASTLNKNDITQEALIDGLRGPNSERQSLIRTILH